jgi:uroporphyrin-III C-methyltransferase/precorrin-2 dehydrogenase/sirohydrochlorin ferrochelatase
MGIVATAAASHSRKAHKNVAFEKQCGGPAPRFWLGYPVARVDYFPIFMDLRGERCLVVGGGEVAARKASLLLRAEARVRVIAPELSEGMRALLSHAALQHEARTYDEADLDNVVLVIAATDDRAVNAQVSSDANALRIPVNVVDDAELCSFIVPALVERSSVVVAIGTAGSAPVLARLLRGRIESMLPERYGDLVELCAELRDHVQTSLPDVNRRRRFWEAALGGGPAELVFRGERAAGETALRAALEDAVRGGAQSASAEAYLIGAGPNDPELVSFRAQRLLQSAEVVWHASHVSAAIVELSRRDALRYAFSGSLDDAADGVLPRMAADVSEGRRVCVLAPGDAFREPAGQRFAARAQQLGVACHIVPGIA